MRNNKKTNVKVARKQNRTEPEWWPTEQKSMGNSLINNLTFNYIGNQRKFYRQTFCNKTKCRTINL